MDNNGFINMKPNEIIELWCDLSRPKNLWTNEGVVGWNPSQCYLNLLTTLENVLSDNLQINLFEVRVVLTCKKAALDNAEHANYKEAQKANVTSVQNLKKVKTKMDSLTLDMQKINKGLVDTHFEICTIAGLQ